LEGSPNPPATDSARQSPASSTRLSQIFARAKEKKRAALVIYLTAQDPDDETSRRLMLAAAEAGADIIEVGIPWSDPSADGKAIQAAIHRALANGGGMTKGLALTRALRQAHPNVGIVLFGKQVAFTSLTSRVSLTTAIVSGVVVLVVALLSVFVLSKIISLLAPQFGGQKNDVQALKAGILEIADAFIVNKADLPGADRAERELLGMLAASAGGPQRPVLRTAATTGQGVGELAQWLESYADEHAGEKRAPAGPRQA